jgi:two-component system, chemotaxis family, protein-glutamate methylesterase/glutaminase
MKYNFKVIGIGSSAGGLDPMKEIIEQLPADINAAIVVVSHLPAKSPSNLKRILERYTGMPVVKVTDRLSIEKGHVYVLGEGNVMMISNRELVVRPRGEDEKINKAIDHFFESMANDVGSNGIGVILSGAGFDGIEGAKAIENENGLVIVQEPYTAQFPLMPQALIANDHPDYVLTPKEIADKLIEHCR